MRARAKTREPERRVNARMLRARTRQWNKAFDGALEFVRRAVGSCQRGENSMRWFFDRRCFDLKLAQFAGRPSAGAENPRAAICRGVAGLDSACFECMRRMLMFETCPNHAARDEFLRPQPGKRYPCARESVYRPRRAVDGDLSGNSPKRGARRRGLRDARGG